MKIELPEKAKPARIESVKFSDGMIVTAEDLDASQQYPVSLLSGVLRAYLGSGVLCGFELTRKPAPVKGLDWVVCVGRGTAIDCDGYPIQLCGPVELDLSPDACACEPPPAEVCIAVRRTTSDEAPRDGCSCDLDAPHFDCRRTQEYAVVKVFTKDDFDALPNKVVKPPPGADLCTALRSCPDCGCGECWILLGCVTLADKKGITGILLDDRRWVKPIAAICPGLTDRATSLEQRATTLEEQTADLKKRLDDLTRRLAQPPAV